MKLIDILKGIFSYWMVAVSGMVGGFTYASGSDWGILQGLFAPILVTIVLFVLYFFKQDKITDAIKRVKE